MVRAQLVPFRWEGHRLDIRAYLGGDATLFVADDVCTALGIHVEAGEYDTWSGITPMLWPLPTEQVDGVLAVPTDPSRGLAQFFTVDQVRELAADRPMYEADDFATWFDQILVDAGGDRLERVVEALTPEEPGRRDLVEGRTFSVRRAAEILDRDPALNFGQKVLFDTLAEYVHWIHREQGIWVPTRETLRAGYLVRHNVRVGARKTLYPQIRITRAGLEYLHQRFGGIAALNLDTAPTLTLLELK
jgi:hypothetical protein